MATADIRTLRSPVRIPWTLDHTIVTLLGIAVATLFVDWEIKGAAKIRLFDIIGFPAALMCIASMIYLNRLKISLNVVLASLFFIVLAAGAQRVSDNALFRETFQGLEMIAMAIAFSWAARIVDWKAIGRYAFFYAIGLLLFVMFYHILHGQYYGWKMLDAGKTIFNFGQPVVMGYLMFRRRNATLLDYAIITGYAAILVFSGERKALIILPVCIGLMLYTRYLNVLMVAMGIAVMAAVLSTAVASTPYLARQISTATEGGSAKDLTFTQLVVPPEGTSPSDLQREFADRVSGPLIKQHPWFGIGTDAFLAYLIDAWGPYLPPSMWLSIHGEFKRTLVENGFVGLGIYCIPWLTSLAWLVANWNALERRQRALYLMAMVAIFVSNYYEGGGQRALVAFLIISLLPEFFGRNKTKFRSVLSLLPKRRAPVIPART